MGDLPKFFELQHFDLDISANLLDSPKDTVVSLSMSPRSNYSKSSKLGQSVASTTDQDPSRASTMESGDGKVYALTEANLKRQTLELKRLQSTPAQIAQS